MRGRIIFTNGQTSAIDWRVNNRRIVDVNFEGKWLTVQMRDQFTRVLAASNDFAVPVAHYTPSTIKEPSSA